MSFTTQAKRPGSAAGVARVISNLLRRAGYVKAGRQYSSEGFYVHRVGYSSSVHVGFHVVNNDRARKRSMILQMREDLFEAGYISSHPDKIYIECTHP
jgi:hypothetical protein